MRRLSLLLCLLFPWTLFAGQIPLSEGSHDPAAVVLFWVSLIFLLAMIGRFLARLFNQPGLLGELMMGVLFGNLCYWFHVDLINLLREGSAVFSIVRELLQGSTLIDAVNLNVPNEHDAMGILRALESAHGTDYIKVGYALDLFSRFGLIFLLFMVGLESPLSQLRHTGKESLRVAVLGILAPVLLGFIVAFFLIKDTSWSAALFVAATLSATSIGVTARVLLDLKKLQTREARTILGAAVFDDILGLMILAVVSSIVINGTFEWLLLIKVFLATILFFAGALFFGPMFLQYMVRYVSFLEDWQNKLFISFIFVMLLSWLATLVGLASMIGAFVAGMIINDEYFKKQGKGASIRNLIAPLEFLMAPLFFMLIGIQVKLESFLNLNVLLMSLGILIAAILGKLISGLGAGKGADKTLIGIGMLPRGEVGLIFASVGRTLGVIPDALFSAITLMVIVTTIIVPPLLSWRYGVNQHRDEK